MRARWLILGALAIAAMGIGAFAVLGGGPADEEGDYVLIGGRDDFFKPEIVRVPVGTTVEWRNVGRNPHTVTAVDGSFDSGIMDVGAEYEHTYATPGIYPFWCTLHGTKDGAGMAGTIVVGDVPLAAAGGGDVGPGREPVPVAPTGTTIRVPSDRPTIQEAVDNATPGDLVLVAPGLYTESVLVVTPYVTIRGEDRNTTILDGEFKKTNGIHVAEADGVAVENMTARHYLVNGFYWTGVNGYRGSYLTAYANGDYGIYAFRSVWGRFEHSFASGSPDSGFYIGECYPCHAVIDDVIAVGSALGYSGTNAGGDLWVINSEWAYNGAGVAPNTLDSEGLAPQREATFAGNSIHDNGLTAVPTKRLLVPTYGTGILVAGGRGNVIEGNVVTDNSIYGIAVLPNVDDTMWLTRDNVIRHNLVRNSGQADLALGGPSRRGDCFEANEFQTSLPPAIETLAGCSSRVAAVGDMAPSLTLLAKVIGALGGNYNPGDWQTAPAAPPQPQMPDAGTAPVVLAVPEIAVPGPHVVRSLAATLAATSSSGSVQKEFTIMGIPLGPIGSTLLGLYAYVLPVALYAAWISIAMWDLIRRELSDRRRIGWMALVLAVPVIGPVAYYGLGKSPIPASVRWFLVVGGISIYLIVAVLAMAVQIL
ncbi:MAG: right-handed parallel beta-helix repeat-containing protein [Candidatus Limnocylindrales bacterium]